MRITHSMLFDKAQAQTAAARDRSFEAQQRVTTGIRVVHPGDDPEAAAIMVSHNLSANRLATIDKTVARGDEELQSADAAFQSVSTLLARARELTVQLGNDTYAASERVNGALEIRSISAQIIQLMNTEVAGRYIFGGNMDRTPPFDSAGAYLGDTAVRQIEVSPGLLENSSVRSDQIIKGVGGGVDVLGNLATIANALAANDGVGTRAALDGLRVATDQVAAALTQTGAMMDGFRSAQSIGLVAKDSLQRVLASETEVDIFDAASELSLAQQGLEATLAVAAKSFQLSLLKYL